MPSLYASLLIVPASRNRSSSCSLRLACSGSHAFALGFAAHLAGGSHAATNISFGLLTLFLSFWAVAPDAVLMAMIARTAAWLPLSGELPALPAEQTTCGV